MSTQSKLVAVSAVLAIMFAMSLSCAADNQSGRSGESIETAAAEPEVIIAPTSTEVAVSAVAVSDTWPAPESEPVHLATEISAMVLTETTLYAAFNGGVVIYDFASKAQSVVSIPDRLTAIAVHGGEVFTGGAEIYRLEDNTAVPLAQHFEGGITTMYSYGDRLMIGTPGGLYSMNALDDEPLLANVSISAMVADESGLWVGTAGQGLFRWDGAEFRRRYLLRDATLFDTVNALDYRHQHLYVGTTNGLNIFDGGRWEVLTTEDGLPGDNVRAIDASAWVVHIGTDAGVVSYYDGEFISAGALDDRVVNAIRTRGSQVIVATDFAGIMAKTRGGVRTLVQPVLDSTFNIASLLH